MISSAVRAGLLAWVAPQRARAACRAGGQLLTTPRGSPFTGMIWRPSGFGVLGSGWGTRQQEIWMRNEAVDDYSYEEGFNHDVTASAAQLICQKNEGNKINNMGNK